MRFFLHFIFNLKKDDVLGSEELAKQQWKICKFLLKSIILQLLYFTEVYTVKVWCVL